MEPKVNISDYTTTIYETQSDFGNAVSLDGSNDYVDVSNTDELNFGTESFTVEAWVYHDPNSTTDFRNIVTKKSTGGTAAGWTLRLNRTDNPQFFLGDDSERVDLTGSTPITRGEWHHLAGVVDSENGEVRLYVDGELVDTQDSIGDISSDTNLIIGSWDVDLNSSNTDPWQGNIDEVRIWNDVRSQEEIQNNLATKLDGTEDNLVAYYNFDQDSVDGSTIADITSNGNDGTLTNGDGNNFVDSEIPTFVGHVDLTLDSKVTNQPGIIVNYQIDSDSTATQDVDFYNSQTDVSTTDSEIQTDSIFIPEGEDSARIYLTALPDAVVEGDETINLTLLPDFNKALDLDGVDDYVELPSLIDPESANAFTAELWFKLDTTGTSNEFLLQQQDGSGTGRSWLFYENNSGKLASFLGGSILLGQNTVTTGVWHHAAVVYDRTTLYLYLDGNQEASDVRTLERTDGELILGNFKNLNNSLDGQIDEVRVWNTARSAEQIQDNIYVNLNGDESNLVAYYNFNQDTVDGTTIADVTGNSNDGTLINGDQSLSLDGVDDNVNTNADVVNLTTADFTIEAWIKTTGTNEGIIVKTDGDTSFEKGEKAFYIDSSGTVNFVGWGNSYINGTTVVNDGDWHHVAVVWDYSSGGTLGTGYIYVDGEEDTKGSSYRANYSDSVISNNYLRIGAPNYEDNNDNNDEPEAPNFFSGEIDEVRIWNTARTAEEIKNNKDTTLSGDESNLVAYYNFNQEYVNGTTIADVTSNNNDGTLTGGNFDDDALQGANSFTDSLAYDPFATNGPTYSIESTQSASITIQDNDAYTATIAIADVYGDEVTTSNPVVGDDGTATFTVKLNSEPTENTVINLSTSQGSLDSSSLTFTTSNWDTFQEVNLSGLSSSFTDFNVTASYSSGDTNFSGISQTVTIADSNDNLRLKVTEGGTELELTPTAIIEATNAEATEGSESGVGVFTVFLDTPAPDGGLEVSFTISPSGVTDGTYELFYNSSSTANTSTSGILSVAGGETSGTITVAVEDNDLDEASKGSVSVTLSTGTGYDLSSTTSEQSATINLVDDDEPGIEFASLTTINSTTNSTIDSSAVDASFNYAVGSLVTSETSESLVLIASGYDEGLVFVQLDSESSSVNGVNLEAGTELSFSNGAVVIVNEAAEVSTTGTTVSVSFAEDSSSNSITSGSAAEVEVTGVDSTGFAVRLNSKPTSDVTLTLTSGDTSEGSFSNSSANKTLTFTTENWDTYQEVEVFSVNDTIDDGNIEYSINAQTSSTDSNYNSIINSISVTNQDNENGVEEVSVEDYEAKLENSSITAFVDTSDIGEINEGTSSSTAQFRIQLSEAAPEGGTYVQYEILSDTGNASEIELTGNIASFNNTSLVYIAEGQTSADINVVSIDDEIAEYDESFEIKLVDNVDTNIQVISAYDADTGSGSIGLRIFDEENENASGEFTLEQGTLLYFSDNSSIYVTEDAVISTNEDSIVPVSVEIVSDSAPTVEAISYQSNYIPVSGSHTTTFTITDDDTAKVLITDSQDNEITSLTTTEDGTSETFYVSLNSEPTENVVVYFGSGNSEEGLLSDSDETNEDVVKLVFTPDNWEQKQQVTINPVDDNVDDDGADYQVVSTVISDDLKYNENSVALQVSADFDPSTDSTISLIIDDLSIKETELTAGTQLTFNDGSVVELGEDISLSNTQATDVRARGSSSIASSATVYYQESISTEITVTNIDNDTAGIIVNTYDTSVEEGYSNNFFNVKLATKPVGEISITMSPTDVDGNKDYNIQLGDEFDGESYTVTFDETSWNVAQAIKVSAVDDYDVEYDHSSYVNFSVSSEEDSTYNAVTTSEQVKINIEDNDLPVASVQTIAAAAEAGAPGYFVITLDTPAPDGFDGTGIVVNYSVSGTVDVDGSGKTDDLKPLTSSVRIAPGESRSPIIAFPIDDFKVEDVPLIAKTESSDDGTVTLNLAINTSSLNDVEAEKLADLGSVTLEDGTELTFSNGAIATVNGDVDLLISSTTSNGSTTYTATAASATIEFTAESATTTISANETSSIPQETVVVSLSSGSDYNLGDAASETLNVEDNDKPGVRIVEIGDTTVVKENGTADVYVSLLSQPEDTVTVTLAPSSTERLLDIDSVDGTKTLTLSINDSDVDSLWLENGQELTFTSNGTTTYTVDSSGTEGYFIDSTGTSVVFDENVSSLSNSSQLTYSYTELAFADANVDEDNDGINDNLQLTFTADDWYQLQTVTFEGIDDNVVEATGEDFHVSTINYTVESDNDVNYDGFTVVPQTINIIDRPFDKENTYQSLSEGFLTLQDSLDSLTLPVLGSLNDLTPSFIEDLLDNIVDEVKATDEVTAKTLQDSFNTAFGTTTTDSGFNSNLFSLSTEITDLSASNIEFLLGIEGEFSESVALDSDLGLSALGIELETEGALDMSFDYGIDLGFGINTDDGFYVNAENTAFEVSAGLDASNSGFTATGNLGFLQLDITDTGTEIGADFTVTLDDSLAGDADGQLTLSELDAARKNGLSDLIKYGFSGDATLALNAETSIQGNTAFPTFEFDLNSNMPIFNHSNADDDEELSGATITVNTTGTTTVTENQSTTINVTASGTDSDTVRLNKGTALKINGDTVIVNQTATLTTDAARNIFVTGADDGNDNTTTSITISNGEIAELISSGFDISFNDITLDLGGFITDLVEPVIGYVNDLIEPFKPIIDVLQTEIELLDTLGLVDVFDQNSDGQATLIEVGTTLASGGNVKYAEFFDAVGGIIDLVESLEDLEDSLSDGANLSVKFGDYTLTDFEGASDDVDASTVDTKEAGDGSSLNSDTKSDASNSGTGTLGTKISNFFTKLDDLGISIPLLEDPFTAVNLLLGQDIDLITYDIPELDIEFNISKEFPIFGSIKGLLEGGFSVYSDLVVGFDTYGLSQWEEEEDFALEDSYLILDGLYLSDVDPDTGDDVDELTLDATVAAGVSASAVVAKAEVKGGITGIAALDIVDGGEYTGESDGKLRGSEVFGADSLLDIFSLSGSLDAFLEAVVKVGIDFGFYEIMKTVWEEEISVTLFEFELNSSSGTVSQSYIEGATVFFDANLNGIYEEGEPIAITDAFGSYDLEVPLLFFDTNDNGIIDPEEGQIVTEGGTDSSSDIALKTPLMAAYGSQMVTPLTTLKQKLVEDGFTAEEAETRVKAALGLPDVNLEEFDPLAAMSQGDEGGSEIYKAHVKVQSLFVQASEFIKGFATESGDEQSLIPQQAIDAISQAIGNYQGELPINLNDATQLQELFQEPLEAAIKSLAGDGVAPEQLSPAVEMLTQTMAYGNEQIEGGFTDVALEDILDTVAPIKEVTQQQLPQQLRMLVDGAEEADVNQLLEIVSDAEQLLPFNLSQSARPSQVPLDETTFEFFDEDLSGDILGVQTIDYSVGDELINPQFNAKIVNGNKVSDNLFTPDQNGTVFAQEDILTGLDREMRSLGNALPQGNLPGENALGSSDEFLLAPEDFGFSTQEI